MLHDFFNWVQSVPGATDGDPSTSWSQQFAGSLHFWSLIEGSHVVALMLFAGTILMVDLRMLGIAFRSVPYSALNDRVLPLTIAGFVLVVATGVLLFLSNPVHYYHSLFFRAKMVFLVVAAVNIFWFHYRVQKSQAEWDAMPSPPAKVKLAAAVSLSSWVLVIVFGRLIGLSFFECETQKPGSFVYIFDECAAQMGPPQPEEEAPPPESAAPQAAPDKPATGTPQ
ncbi:MAG TPA: DUF6644 family protein [Hyphomonadaceae bacterium]|nr:DUF6644 family protein [Hyphomonadaceae bacterium]